ncbi:MAG: hypothetical protein WCB94_11850 [Terriglobales bacterium]
MNRSARIGQFVLCLFALPFALGGLLAISQAFGVTHANKGNMSFWLLLPFGLVFGGIGFGLIFAALYGGRYAQRQQRLQVEHPAEPWLWRADWAQGRANSKTRTSMLSGWIFAIFWNAISMPIAFLVLPAATRQKGPVAYLGLIFPAVGVLLLVYAIRRTIAFFEFGNTYFEMSTLPGVVGRELNGQIQARFPHSPDHGVHLRLSCVHRMQTGSGNTQSTTENILWRDEADLASGQLCPGPNGTTIPVHFRIPLDAQATEKRSPRDEFVWVLEALADVPGVDYHDIFEVPVFRTQRTPSQAEAEKFAAPVPVQPVTRPQVVTIEVRQAAEGTEFYFPPARNKSFAASATVFALIFGSITFFLIHHAPILFPLVFGSFTLLLLYISIQLWFGTTRVVMGGGVTLQAGLLGGGKVRRIALSEIASISDQITSQQGGATGVPYYDIDLTLRDGKKLTLGRSVRDKHETEWLVEEMRRLAGVQAKSMTARVGTGDSPVQAD